MTLRLLILGVVIGSNNFATTLAMGALGQIGKRRRILLVFALFEFTVPLVGLWLGRGASSFVADRAGWLGPALIAGLGLWTIYEATGDSHDHEKLAHWLTSWSGLFLLAGGLSVDNLVVGFSLGLGGIHPLALATTIMVFSVVFSWVGLQIGERAQRSFEKPAEAVSGALLLGVAWMSWSGWL